MNETPTQDTNNKRNALAAFIWWKPDPAEIEKQVAQYNTLPIWKAARGVSMLCCLFSVAITVLLGGTTLKLPASTIAIEAVMWSALGLFMFRGARWAFMAGMVVWTLEKAMIILTTPNAIPVAQLFWWMGYMSAFFLGYKVEERRAARSTTSSPRPA